MLRIEGNRSGRWIARLLAVAAAAVAWVANPATASAQGVTQWIVQGPQGGPFTPTAGTVKIVNPFGVKVRWYVTGDKTWVDVPATSGIIGPGQSKNLDVQLNAAAAASKQKGTYKSLIAFRNPANGSYTGAAELVLMVQDPPSTSGKLEVTPPDGLSSTGTQGGTFAPLSKTYTLNNTGNAAVGYRVTFDDTWVGSQVPIIGQLQPGGSTPMPVDLDLQQLKQLGVGQHTSTVRFWDTNVNLEVATRQVSVEVKTATSGSGWTQFTPSPDTRTVYVSSSQGNDANNGLSEATPKKTINAGVALLRSGYPDWLLLKKGDTWSEVLSGSPWNRSGRSASEPMRIGAYGNGPRPLLSPPQTAGSVFYVGGGSPSFLAITDLHMRPQSVTKDYIAGGVEYFGSGTNILVEGCLIEHYYNGVTFYNLSPNGAKNVKVRRNVIMDTQRRGVLALGVTNYLAEENFFVRVGSINPGLGYFHQSAYISNEYNSGIQIRGNLVAECLSGTQIRAGGTAEDNLYARCSMALQIGGGSAPQYNPDGVDGIARNNVILECQKPAWGDHGLGWGITLENIRSCVVDNNIVANGISGSEGMAIYINGLDTGAKAHNISLTDNVVYNWVMRDVFMKGPNITDLVIEGNDFQEGANSARILEILDSSVMNDFTSGQNHMFSSLSANQWILAGGQLQSLAQYKNVVDDTSSVGTKLSYPNAGAATLAGYHGSLGKAASYDAFIAEVVKQSKDYWRPEYTAASANAFIRSAFGAQP